jgi:hypothetical protein
VRLWTYQPSDFRPDAKKIDPTRGRYWRDEARGFRYRKILTKLQKLVGTDQFLWCYTVRPPNPRVIEDVDVIEWELDVPLSHVLRFIHSHVWEGIFRSQRDDWENLDDWKNLLIEGEPSPGEGVHALVRWPLPDGALRSHRQPQPQHSAASLKYAEEVKKASENLPAAERDAYDF